MALSPKFDSLERPLLPAEVKKLHFGEVRKLHPDEILASMSFKAHELPRLSGRLSEQHEAVCQTVCVNVFEAFAAEALVAMGYTAPRERLLQSLGTAVVAPNGQSEWLQPRESGHGVCFEDYLPLMGSGAAEADRDDDDAVVCYNDSCGSVDG